MNESILIAAAMILLASVLASKISDRYGIPVLLLFLLLGMLAGSDGVGGIYFDDPALAQSIGLIALVLILFSGGLNTVWNSVQPIFKEGLVLATLGVLVTAVSLGAFVYWMLDFSLLEALLTGAIVSSTDAAAVFSVLRAKGISLKGRLAPLLELESGSNDPMAIFLTTGLISLITHPELPLSGMIGQFFTQMLLGGAIGFLMGRATLYLINHIRLGYEGLYPVLTLAMVLLTFGVTDLAGGNGFLAVYLTGILLGKADFIHKKSLMRFHDGLAWLMQIAMFLTLGLLVFPSRIIPVVGIGMLTAMFLMFIARPFGVFLCLIPSRFNWREKTFISWVGLRGAVPIILATYPLLARLPQADLIFNVVFFVVMTSVLLQGTSLPLVARWLKLDAPYTVKRIYPIEYIPMEGLKSELKELTIPPGSIATGKAIFEIGFPEDFLVILIARQDEFLVPSGGTVLQERDTLLALSPEASFMTTRKMVNRNRT